jgi:GT2 family glycosyltransferase
VSSVDVVVVSYNSRAHLRRCVEPLAGRDGVQVIVVDNASPEESLDVVADLPVRTIRLARNGGFAYGCNAGWRAGDGDYVLLLNPDATLDADAVARLAAVLDEDPRAGAVGPRIEGEDGSLHWSLRRFPRPASSFAQAFFLHRIFPQAPWSSELVRDVSAYGRPGSPDWVSGACILVRRSTLERLDGLDEGFFMYWEDTDLCRRIRDLGLDIRYEPSAVAVHVGGASASRVSLLSVFAESRVRYARKHSTPAGAVLEQGGAVVYALVRALAQRGARGAHLRSLGAVVRRRPASA